MRVAFGSLTRPSDAWHPPGMTIIAKVQNHQIALPHDMQVEDGTDVQVNVPDDRIFPPAAQNGVPQWLRRSLGTATSGLSTDAIMRLTRGEE